MSYSIRAAAPGAAARPVLVQQPLPKRGTALTKAAAKQPIERA
jgi:hypothetical protein